MKIGSLGLIFILTFLSGARFGATEFIYADASNHAAIATFHIEALKDGLVEEMISIHEIELDGHLKNHRHYLESSFKWLFPEARGLEKENLKKAIEYRLSNPSNINREAKELFESYGEKNK